MGGTSLLYCCTTRKLCAQQQEGCQKAKGESRLNFCQLTNLSFYANCPKREASEVLTDEPLVPSRFSGTKHLLQSGSGDYQWAPPPSASILQILVPCYQSSQGWSLMLYTDTAHGNGWSLHFLPLMQLLEFIKSQHLCKKFYCGSSIPITCCKC